MRLAQQWYQVNFYLDQIVVSNVMPIAIKANHCHEQREERGANHRTDSHFENRLRHLWIINKNPQRHAAKENL